MTNTSTASASERLPDFGNLAAHVVSAIGTLKGYGHEQHASTKGLQHVLDELMKLYEDASHQPNASASERLLTDAALCSDGYRCACLGPKHKNGKDKSMLGWWPEQDGTQPKASGVSREAHHAESVRCMSIVLSDLATMLGTEQGEPDALFDAIEALQEKAKLAPKTSADVESSLPYSDDIYNLIDRTERAIVRDSEGQKTFDGCIVSGDYYTIFREFLYQSKLATTPSGHHANCGWHVDQYNWECDCGFLGETTMKAAMLPSEDEAVEILCRAYRYSASDGWCYEDAMYDAYRDLLAKITPKE